MSGVGASGLALSPVWAIAGRTMGNVLGLPFSQYRPAAADNPLATLFATIPAWITADFKGMADRDFKDDKPIGTCWADTSLIQNGDYLVGARYPGNPIETFFVAADSPPAPIEVVRCNGVMTFTRPGTPAVGPEFYSGAAAATAGDLMAAWPSSVLPGTKGEKGEVTLPGDVRTPWFKMLVPAVNGVQLRPGDIATDIANIPNQYTLGSVLLTPRCWLITAMLATP